MLRRRTDVELLDTPAVMADGAGREIPDLGTATVGSGDRQGRTAQLWPHLHGTDAMFVALLRRSTS